MIHSKALQETSEGKETKILGSIQTVSQKSEVVYYAKIVSEHQKFSVLSACEKSEILSVKTTSGSIRSSVCLTVRKPRSFVCLTCRENSEVLRCAKTVSEHSRNSVLKW